MDLSNLLAGFGTALTPEHLLFAAIGVLLGTAVGVLPGIVGSIQALEAIKVLLGIGEPLIGRILTIDTTDMSIRTFNLKPDPDNEVTYANRDRIEVRDLDGLCAPWVTADH